MVEAEIEEKRAASGNHLKDENKLIALFPFDPNVITKGELIQLGLKEKTAETFVKYRSKGFKFKQKEDVQKIYGISPKLYSQLEPYILIKNDVSTSTKKDNSSIVSLGKKLELNSADSLGLLELKGVGPSYAKRIIKYRSMLGGFVSMDQVKEIYGMSNELYLLLASQCTINASAVKKININSADFKTVNKHPYIDYELTKRIFNYKKGGKITNENVSDVIEDDGLLIKIKPYLEF